MPVRPVKHIASFLENGVGSFVQPCKRITLRYCNWGGSSKGMRDLLRNDLKKIAEANPKVEFVVKKEAGHPIVQGEYASGNLKTVCVRNFDAKKILQKIELVRNSSGNKLVKYQRAVESHNPSVRGIWSPFHVEKEFRYRV